MDQRTVANSTPLGQMIKHRQGNCSQFQLFIYFFTSEIMQPHPPAAAGQAFNRCQTTATLGGKRVNY